MPQRNGQRSSRGRGAVARRVMMGGATPTNGIMPRVQVTTAQGNIITTSYFGGPKKGGLAPNATAPSTELCPKVWSLKPSITLSLNIFLNCFSTFKFK